MTRDQFERELQAWLNDVRHEALKNFDTGTGPPLCLPFAVHRVHLRWLEQAHMLVSSVVPPTLFPRN